MKKLLAFLLVFLFVALMLPLPTAAQEVDEWTADEMDAYFEDVWASLESAETRAIEGAASKEETLDAVYLAATQSKFVDQGTISELGENGFSFKTIDGYACAYDYVTNELGRNGDWGALENVDTTLTETRAQTTSNTDVLLIGPFYGMDSNFTNQYKTEALSVANYMGGTAWLISGANASATAICQNIGDAGVVFVDSHGASYYGTSYIQLTSGVGITQTALSNESAVNFGYGIYGIDGRFIRDNSSTGRLPSSLIWISVCEGMKTNGLATPLREAGAEVVYGYSQSVTFDGDYLFEEAFWGEMKTGATVAEAASYMKLILGSYDPGYEPTYQDIPAYPIFVSDYDSYPSNPNAKQAVKSDWQLYKMNSREICLTGQRNYEPYFSYDSDGNLIYYIYIQGLTEDDYISALEYEASWDPNKLQLSTYLYYGYENPNPALSDIHPTISASATSGRLSYALASNSGLAFPNTLGVLVIMKFKVKQSVPLDEYIWINFSGFKLSLVNKNNVPISQGSYTTSTVSGIIVHSNPHYEYHFISDTNNIILTGYAGPGGDIAIPSTIYGSPVTVIDSWTFFGCDTITSITIPSGITGIGSQAFYFCSSLTSINVSDYNTKFKDIDGVLFRKDGTAIICFPASKDMKDYTIPNGVISIDPCAFLNCSLTSVTIPYGVTSIGEDAFAYSSYLKSVNIPDSVTTIGACAFTSCFLLDTIVIPRSVTSIAYRAFYNCEGLDYVIFEGAPPSFFGEEVFYTLDYLSDEIVPLNITLYYYPEFSHLWAPNGETTWMGHKIKELTGASANYFTIVNSDGTTDRQYARFTYGGGVEYEYDCLTNLPPNTTAEQLESMFGANVGELSGKLKTGDSVTVNGERFRVIIMGDVTCDGETDSKDAAEILRAVVKLATLNELQENAANTQFAATYGAADAAAVLRFVVQLQATVGKLGAWQYGD
ncbi:MAG: leucine-rich repeat protein [Clostridia bacterium]|nr:leucine-rich repeat protein [Clostridia bacterium]